MLGQQNFRHKTLLPKATEVTCAGDRHSRQQCFLSGGHLTNLLPTHTALHTIWLRQHNNIAKQLKVCNILIVRKNKRKTFENLEKGKEKKFSYLINFFSFQFLV